MRTLTALVVLLFIGLALLGANRSKPLLAEARLNVPRDSEAPPPTPVYDLCPYDQPKDPSEIHRA